MNELDSWQTKLLGNWENIPFNDKSVYSKTLKES